MIKENVIKETFNAKETFEIGYQLGQLAKKGQIFRLARPYLYKVLLKA